jgi:small subunit ribosomal protein S6
MTGIDIQLWEGIITLFCQSGKSSYFCVLLFKNKFNKEMLNQYETVFITTPVLSESQMKEAVDKFKTILTDNGAEIVNEENWGLRKLAYPIQKKSTGFYYLIQFKSEGSLIDKLETEYRRDERIIRFLTVRLDKYGAEYAEKKRNKKSEETEKVKEN